MKKNLLRILCLVLCLSTVLAFCSCTGQGEINSPTPIATPEETPIPTPTPFVPQSAEELQNKIDSVMDSAVSYTVNATSQFKFYQNGLEFVTKSEGVIIYSSANGSNYRYSNIKSNVTCASIDFVQDAEQTEAFYDGKMYVSNVYGETNQKFCSPMTYEEYVVAQSTAEITEEEYLDCTKKEFAQNDDGTWKVVYSGYTGKAIASLFKKLDVSEEELGDQVIDMEFTFEANADFYVTKLTVKAVFEADSKAEFITEEKYSNINSTEANVQDINTSEYVEVSDVRVLKDFSDGIENLENSKNAKITYENHQIVRVGTQTSTFKETDTIKFGVENGAYYYDIDSNGPNGDLTIKYKNGSYQVSGSSEKYLQTDSEAKELISGFINAYTYNPLTVSEIKKTGDNTFELKIGKPADVGVQSVFEQLGSKATTVEQTINVTLEGKNVKKVESVLRATGLSQGGQITLTLNLKLTINEAVYE